MLLLRGISKSADIYADLVTYKNKSLRFTQGNRVQVLQDALDVFGSEIVDQPDKWYPDGYVTYNQGYNPIVSLNSPFMWLRFKSTQPVPVKITFNVWVPYCYTEDLWLNINVYAHTASMTGAGCWRVGGAYYPPGGNNQVFGYFTDPDMPVPVLKQIGNMDAAAYYEIPFYFDSIFNWCKTRNTDVLFELVSVDNYPAGSTYPAGKYKLHAALNKVQMFYS